MCCPRQINVGQELIARINATGAASRPLREASASMLTLLFSQATNVDGAEMVVQSVREGRMFLLCCGVSGT